MNAQSYQRDLPKPKRPWILTIICIVYLFLFALRLVQLSTPSSYLAAIDKFPHWIVQYQIVFNLLGLASIVGVWQMRKWGIYLFFSTVAVSMVVMYVGLQSLPNVKAFALLYVFLYVTLKYFIELR